MMELRKLLVTDITTGTSVRRRTPGAPDAPSVSYTALRVPCELNVSTMRVTCEYHDPFASE